MQWPKLMRHDFSLTTCIRFYIFLISSLRCHILTLLYYIHKRYFIWLMFTQRCVLLFLFHKLISKAPRMLSSERYLIINVFFFLFYYSKRNSSRGKTKCIKKTLIAILESVEHCHWTVWLHFWLDLGSHSKHINIELQSIHCYSCAVSQSQNV